MEFKIKWKLEVLLYIISWLTLRLSRKINSGLLSEESLENWKRL